MNRKTTEIRLKKWRELNEKLDKVLDRNTSMEFYNASFVQQQIWMEEQHTIQNEMAKYA